MVLHPLNRRHILLAGLSFLPWSTLAGAEVVKPKITAYRNPGCGCCGLWADGLRKAGFKVEMVDDPDLDARRTTLGVPKELAGCHTAVMGKQVIEGHVPAEDIIQLLTAHSDALGLAVAGMPVGSPGMEMGVTRDAYDVILIKHYPAS
jgi:hypothetical protein